MNRRSGTAILIALSTAWFACVGLAYAESAIDLLSGFDEQRISNIAVPIHGDVSQSTSDELAKLIFRLRRLSDSTLRGRVNDGNEKLSVGDVTLIGGKIDAIETIQVSKDLVELLGLERISLVTLQGKEPEPAIIQVAMSELPKDVVVGDRLSGVGVLIAKGDQAFYAADRLAWSSQSSLSPSWAAINDEGIDLSRLRDIADKSGQPLTSTDSEVFYRLIHASEEIARSTNPIAKAARANAKEVEPIKLLQNPQAWIGQWISLDVETVRITRVAVDSTPRRDEVGSDHYYQIDAIGDLGKVQVRIDRPDGEPIVMQNRYPVTVITASVPTWLVDQTAEADWMVKSPSVPIRIEGFFYRLWSYDSDFMQSQGGGKQTAPLVMAGRLMDRRSKTIDPIGVGMIGKIGAVAVLLGIVGVTLFQVVTTRGDRLARRRRLND